MQIIEIASDALLEQGGCVCFSPREQSVWLVLLHGPAEILLPDGACRAKDGNALLLRSQKGVQLTAYAEDLLYDFLLLEPGSDTSFLEALHIPENTVLHCPDAAFLKTVFQQLTAAFFGNGSRRSDLIGFLLKAALIRLSESGAAGTQAAQSAADPRYAELVRLREKIYANPQERWTVEMLCSEVNMSRSYFQLLYREAFGLTCIADVINCKMNRARELLTATGYTIAHIAQLCGYDNEEHFMRQFKKNNGVTPTVYRREHTGE